MVRVVMEGRFSMEKAEAFFAWVNGPEFAQAAAAAGMKNWVISRPLSGEMIDGQGALYLLEWEVENLAGVGAVTGSEAFMKLGQGLFEHTGIHSMRRTFHTIVAHA